ncbi:BON domain-containing protein [Hydrogenophilus thiooxidans]|uniref:BON domain-containing protein n=1 Tax=Hydrogenophilus thiooxidans TaxID=2820326 RepID=UPI001C23BACF|nr:BON domain-containing protein [Hydrogenophilus thiooxidans]
MKKTTLTLTLGLAVLTPTLSGCFPAVATGVAATAAVAADRRTGGAIVEDEQLEWKISSAIQQALGDRAHVNVTSFNRIVLLTGEVPDEAAKQRAETLAKKTENVRTVVNELIIAPPSALASRANDASLTTQVKARLVGNRDVPAHLVKVVTEGGVVFLMGLVTRREGDAATYVARTTSGVKRVVRVFEFISDEEAKRLDHAAKQSQNGR